MMTKNDPFVRLDEIFAIIVRHSRRGTAVIDHEHACGDPFRIKPEADGISAERRREDENGVQVLATVQGDGAVCPCPRKRHVKPDHHRNGLFHGAAL